MGERRSTTRSRDLGVELAKIRRAAQLDAKAVAFELACAASKVTRIEQGRQGIEDAELIAWLHLCGALPQMRRLIELSQESSKDSWLQPIGAWGQRTLLAEEARATRLVWYEIALIPGLLQTEAYIRAFASNEEQVNRRIERQKVLRSTSTLETVFFIEEQALRRPVGGSAVMRDQLTCLLRMSEWKRIAIRVLPTHLGVHPGLAGSFILFDNSVVYTDMAVANVFLENPADVQRYEGISKSLAKVALSAEESRALIRRLREDHDDPAGDLA